MKKKIFNFITDNSSMIIGSLISFLVIRITVQKLGLGTYGSIALVISIGNIVIILANALSGAAARYVTLDITKGDNKGASIYFSNTFFSIIIIGISALLIFSSLSLFLPNFSKGIPFGFLEIMLISVLLSALGGVLTTGNFVKEEFISRAIINIVSYIFYGLICIFLLYYTPIGIWSISIGALIGALIRFFSFWILFKKKLPEIFINFHLINKKHIIEVGSFVSWMLLAFLGGYMTKTGSMIILKLYVPDVILGKYALAIMVGNFLQRSLVGITVITSPDTYKFIALKLISKANKQIEKFIFLSLLLGSIVIIIIFFEGQNLLNIWLGESAPENIILLLIGTSFSAIAISLSVPISVYLAGHGHIKKYGIISLIEGLVVLIIIYIIIILYKTNQITLITYIPGILSILKNILMIILFERALFKFSPIKLLYIKFFIIIILDSFSITLGLLIYYFFQSQNIFLIPIKLFLILIPFMIYITFLIFIRKKAIFNKISYLLI